MTERFPTTSRGAYAPPGAAGVGLDVDGLRDFVLQEFGKVAEALRAYPTISVNSISRGWAMGSLLSIASSGTAPAAGVRGVHPVAVYGDAVDRIGSVNFRIMVAGKYRLTLVHSTDAPGGGTVKWTGTTGILGSEVGLTAEQLSTGEIAGSATAVAGSVTNKVKWTPVKDYYLDSPCVVGVAIRRNAGVAPDTGTSAAYILGVALERLFDHA